jgi:hypothetical protein
MREPAEREDRPSLAAVFSYDAFGVSMVASSRYDPGDHLLIPDHIGYSAGQRGIAWEAYQQSRLGGLIEVYSNHGCAISDESPFDYFHTMGPRDGTKTMASGLQQGIRCGFIGSTDSHDGFPGHYSHGRVGVLGGTAAGQRGRPRRRASEPGRPLPATLRHRSLPSGRTVHRRTNIGRGRVLPLGIPD